MRHAQWLVPVMAATIAACAPQRQDAQQVGTQRDIVQVEEGPTLICVDRDNGRTYVDCSEPGCTGFDEHPGAFTDEMIVDVLGSHRRRHRRLTAARLPVGSPGERFLIFVGAENKVDENPEPPPPVTRGPNLALPWNEDPCGPRHDSIRPVNPWRVAEGVMDFTALPDGLGPDLTAPTPPVHEFTNLRP